MGPPRAARPARGARRRDARVAGATYQGVFRNPLADPYLLGVAAGAGLGATLAIAYLRTAWRVGVLPFAAFGGRGRGDARVRVGRSARRERDAATLILAGVTVTCVFTALGRRSFSSRTLRPLQEVYSWILGNIPSTGWTDVRRPRAVRPRRDGGDRRDAPRRRRPEPRRPRGRQSRRGRAAHAARARGRRNGRHSGGRRGVRADRVRRDHRPARDPTASPAPSYRGLLPLSFVVGAGFLILADVVARTALAPAEVPIGVITALFGAPFFAFVLRTRGGRA